MQVMTYGSTYSPSCKQAVKNFNASKFSDKYPKAAMAIVEQHYVDDYLDSFDTEQEASQISKQVIEIHDTAGFCIRSFISNSEAVIQSLPKDLGTNVSLKQFSEKDSVFEKVPRVYWNTSNNSISYTINMNKLSAEVLRGEHLPTKREILAFVMSIYNPLGLISNTTIHGKILLQKLHKKTQDWDHRMPERLGTEWSYWLELVKQTENMSIPRRISIPDATDIVYRCV